MRVKDLENFPKEKVYNPNCAMPTAEEYIGFNEARSIIGELTVLEPIDFVEAEKMLYEVELKDLKGDEINLWWEVRERYHKKLKEICQRFGTSAVGTGKQDLTKEQLHFDIERKNKEIEILYGKIHELENSPRERKGVYVVVSVSAY